MQHTDPVSIVGDIFAADIDRLLFEYLVAVSKIYDKWNIGNMILNKGPCCIDGG